MGINQASFLPFGLVARTWGRSKQLRLFRLATLALLLLVSAPSDLLAQRTLGIDVSSWQGNISQTTWNNLRTVDNRQFAIVRSSRGGTTGFYNQNDSDNSDGNNTLSQRYDDPYYIQNINRATTAGIFAGSYHFSRPDILESTLNSGGIRNSGTDEANHFIQMAGPWMRPGYLVPVHDLEAGDGKRTDDEMAQFCIDFSTRIYQVMGIRPAIYMNGNYAANIMGGASVSLRDAIAKPAANLPSVVSPAYPTLWSARWPNQADPNSIDVHNGEPKDSYASIYGPWDDYGVTHPWKFWQYASTAILSSYGSRLDVDVVRGGMEFLKDQLIPAVWMNDLSGNWSTLANWNCGKASVAPVTGAGQATPVATSPLPSPRLPGAAGTGVTSGQHDTVILERPAVNIVVTLSSGTYNIRKLYMRETLNISGGSLAINFVPSTDSTTNGAQFSGPVTLSGSGAFQAHTLQVDAGYAFTLAGGTLTFNTIKLMPHSTTPAKILASGDVNLNSLSNVAAVITVGAGSGTSGSIDLGAATRTLTVGNGAADVDLSVSVPISNGGLTKAGPGTMLLNSASSYGGGTTISAGRLLINNTTSSGTGGGEVTVNAGVLGGTGRISGVVTVNNGGTIAPGTTTSMGTLTVNSAPNLGGTNVIRINRNAGIPLADRLLLTSGTLNYSGTLVVTNTGAGLAGGEVFTPFAASAYSGAFAAAKLPALTTGLNWYLDGLAINGTLKVNRAPVADGITVVNTPGQVLQIPLATLIGAATDADGDSLSVAGFDTTTTNGVTVSSDGTFISCLNTANVADHFGYTISDGHGGTASGLVQVTPGIATPPSITAHPQGRTNAAGTDAMFSVMATGTAPLSYQWRFNGLDIAAASDATYTRVGVRIADEGGYSVVVSNVAGVVTSSTAGLTVVQPLPARIEFFTMLPDGQFHFRVSGSPGQYAIEATTNFLNWEDLTNFVTTNSLFEYTDGNTNLTRRGYRTRLID